MSAPTRTIVLGGTGYVAGELLRLLAVHPFLREVAVISESQPGKRVEEVFPHLAGAFPDLVFQGGESLERLVGENDHVAVFSAAPHGASAPLLDKVLDQAERSGARANLVDLSADFRYPTALEYERVYGHPHGAPGRIGTFVSAVPELATGPGFAGARHVCLPGCFTTAVLLAVVPLLKLGLIEPRFSVVAMTGSTGAGRTPTATTHHPERRSNVFAYNPLGHRHEPEMRLHASAAAGAPVEIAFVPQSGPYARGIYATIQARTARPTTTAQAVAELAAFYAGSPFVAVGEKPPRLQDVVGTNRARLGLAVHGDDLVAFSAIDNLVKGAAGGGVQWMNRLLDLPEVAGLAQPGLGWI